MSLRANSLSFSYSSERSLLSDLSLGLRAGAKVALTGANGSGKSTLLRLLAGKSSPDQGSVSGSSETAYLEQYIHTTEMLASGGEKRITTLREAFASDAPTLLLDEPTNDLDQDAREWLRQAILASSASIILASHDPMILDLVDEIWELRQGKISKHPPGYEQYINRLDEEESRLKRQIGSLRAESRRADAHAKQVVATQEKRMSRGAAQAVKENLPKIIRGAKKRQAQGTLARVKAIQEDRSEQVRDEMLQARQRLRSLSMFDWDSGVTRPPAGRKLVSVRNAKLPGCQERVSFEMLGPRRVHLKGGNGSGKTTLLRALSGDPGALSRVEGEFYLAEPFRLFDQELSRFVSTDPLWKWFQEKTLLPVSMARTVLGRLGFEQEEQLRPVSVLSGGERVRLEIAVALQASEPPQVLLLDEPTNHLDLESRRILHSFVKAFEGGLVVVSHDSVFVSSLEFDEVIDLAHPNRTANGAPL